MKTILISLFITAQWISTLGQPNPSTDDGKLPYESIGIMSRITDYGLDDVNDSEDPSKVELQFLRRRDSYCVSEKIFTPIKDGITGIFTQVTDACEKDFTSVSFFSAKQIEIVKKAGTLEEKPIEITRYKVDPANINFQVHKCSCNIKGTPNEESKSFCIDGFAYLTEGVNGKDSYFVLSKSSTSDNLNLKAQVTLSNASNSSASTNNASASPTTPANPTTSANPTPPNQTTSSNPTTPANPTTSASPSSR